MYQLYRSLKVALVLSISTISIDALNASESEKALDSLASLSHKRRRDSSGLESFAYFESFDVSSKRPQLDSVPSLYMKELKKLTKKIGNEARYNTINFQLSERSAVKLLTSDKKIQKEIEKVLSTSPISNVHFLDITEQEKITFNNFLEKHHSKNTWSDTEVKLIKKIFKFLHSEENINIANNYLEYSQSLALLGHPKAQHEYSSCVADNKEKNKLLHFSASQGYAAALFDLYNIYQEKGQTELADIFLKVAALKRHEESQVKFAYQHSDDLLNVQDKRHLALLDIFSLSGNKMALRVKTLIENSPEVFNEI